MMWRVWHHIFGWHFVVYTNSCGDYVRRVRFTAEGAPYVKWCNQFIWMLERQASWRALTFDKAKWIAEQPFDAAGHPLPFALRRTAA